MGVKLNRTPSGRSWVCASGRHRYHRDRRVAEACVYDAMSMRDAMRLPTITWREINQGWVDASTPSLKLDA